MYIWVLFTPFTTKMLIQLFTVYCLGYCNNPLNRLSSLSLSISRNIFQEPEWSFKNINMIMLLLYPDLSSVFPSHLKTKETFFQRLTELSKICFLIGFRYYSSCFCPPNPTHSSNWPADIHARVFAVIVPCAVNHDSSASDLMSRGDQRSLACQSSLKEFLPQVFFPSYWVLIDI